MKLVALCLLACAWSARPEAPSSEYALPAIADGAIFEETFEGGSIVAARHGRIVTGVIRDGNALFEIVTRGDRTVVEARSWDTARPLHGEGWGAIASEHGVPPKPAVTSAPIEIDVLFAYTQRVLEQRTLDGIRGLVDVAITETNQACAAGHLSVRFRVAGLVRTTGTEVGKDIRRLHHDLLNRTDFLDAHAERAKRRADVLFLLVDKVQGGLGVANVMAEPTTAVAVADYHDSVLFLTIPHELGHLMGARHDVAEDDRDFPFPYGHGFVGKTSRTIMATPCARPATCPLVVRWSSPPNLGDALTADDARVIRETAAAVAAFGDQLSP